MNAAELLLGTEALARHGERVALICGDERVRFSQLAERMARTAAAFAQIGVRPGDRVAFLMRDTPEFAAAWLGAVYAGAVAVALNRRLSAAELAYMLADSAPRVAVADEPLEGLPIDAATQISSAGLAARASAVVPASAVSLEPAAPAFILYSSGTSGQAKGIVHRQRAFSVVGRALARIGIGPGDRVLSTSRLFFAYGLEHGLLGPLAAGATSILCPDWPDSDGLIALVSQHRPDALFSVPTIYRRLLAERRAQLAPFRTVRRFVAAGERMSSQLGEQWRAATGAELLNLYGMSETFCACMMTPPGGADGPCTGIPFDDVEIELRDAGGRATPPGEPGVLWVRHPAQASGYLNRPEQTAALFRDGWFCSRDLFVRNAEGHYVPQGRVDELVKVAGQWVQPGELEEVAAAEQAVLEAACVPVADAEGLERLALFVTPRHEPAQAEHAAAAACERLLPRHKRPKWVRAVKELPRTATGKVQRFKLREILERELRHED